MKISVIGTGYVGLVSGVCLADMGHEVVCVDIDQQKVDSINRGIPPIYEVGLEDLLKRNIGERLSATLNFRNAVLNTELTIIAVGTPFDGRNIDLSYIEKVSQQIGEVLKNKNEYHVVVVKSTVVPGTTDNVVSKVVEQCSGKIAGRDFGVGMNPEFLTEGVAIRDFENPDRIVLGGIDEKTIAVMDQVYKKYVDVPKVRTNNKTAEMIKYASNSVLATMISFSNEIADLCYEIGDIDVKDVLRGVHHAQYFTTRNAEKVDVIAPITSFLEAGCGYGGSCLPKDTKALKAQGKIYGLNMALIGSVIDINSKQTRKMIDLAKKHFPSLKRVNVTVLGLAFKPDTDDIRESPALALIAGLIEEGANVTAHDPIAIENARKGFAKNEIIFTDDLEQAVANAEIIMLVTRWQHYDDLNLVLNQGCVEPVVIDGRRVLEPGDYAKYEGIGLRKTS